MMYWLILIHRWLGIVGCLLFAAWFFSGVVLMYVQFPALTPSERITRLPALEFDKVQISADEAWHCSGEADTPQRVRLNQIVDRPIYHFLTKKGLWRSVYADTCAPLVDPTLAAAQPLTATSVASANRHISGHVARVTETVELDQWTVSSSLNAFRPLHIVTLDDAAGTELYVSSRTGEVVRDTDRFERGWNWVGAVTHWIYPVQLRQYPKLWRDVVVWISIPATIIALTGLILGVARFRWRGQFKSGHRTPYRGWTRWHHWFGLFFAVTTVTWIFSGLMSMNPFNIFSSKSPEAALQQAWKGGVLALNYPVGDLKLAHLSARTMLANPIKEVESHIVAGATYLQFFDNWDSSAIVNVLQPHAASREFGRKLLEGHARAVLTLPEAMTDPRAKESTKVETNELAAALTFEWLVEYDLYYYAQHTPKRLPVLRVKRNDHSGVWYHIQVASGALSERYDQSNRIQRWIYNGLHSWNFRPLWDHRPLWDVLVIVFSVGGFLLALTSVVISWRRLRHKLKRPA